MEGQAVPVANMSLLKAIDGSHLAWFDFRQVLGAFRVVLNNEIDFSSVSQHFTDRLKLCLEGLSRFESQETVWRNQLSCNRGFGLSVIFPPNVLPPLPSKLSLHRYLTPRLSREALPPRVHKSQDSLFELPVPRPHLSSAFTSAAFDERELSVLPTCASTSGTIVDFESGSVAPGTTAYCPFLTFERINGATEDAVETAKNQCAIAGAHCIRSFQMLFRRCSGVRPVFERPISFSCAINNTIALINYHFVDAEQRYCMTELFRFNLDDPVSFKEFQAWIEAIEEWATAYLLPVVKIALRQLLSTSTTPPVSPMPSLTLSIDTVAGAEEVLLKALRATFSSIKWTCQGHYETPLNSSVAHCGTPRSARRFRTLTLSPTSPTDLLSGISGPTTPFSSWRMRPDWTGGSRSPVTRRHPLSPLKLRADIPESPCRPATMSPCTPPPEAPSSAKAPVLVLQKRVDLAMDEIRELRALVETLQGELQAKNQRLDTEHQSDPIVPDDVEDHGAALPVPSHLTSSPDSDQPALASFPDYEKFSAATAPRLDRAVLMTWLVFALCNTMSLDAHEAILHVLMTLIPAIAVVGRLLPGDLRLLICT
jgi:hypothetical protein